jgi:hypothetical protein
MVRAILRPLEPPPLLVGLRRCDHTRNAGKMKKCNTVFIALRPWMLHLGSGCQGGQLQPQYNVCCWREKSQQQPKVYNSGPILLTQNLVASYEYLNMEDFNVDFFKGRF